MSARGGDAVLWRLEELRHVCRGTSGRPLRDQGDLGHGPGGCATGHRPRRAEIGGTGRCHLPDEEGSARSTTAPRRLEEEGEGGEWRRVVAPVSGEFGPPAE